MCCFTLFRLPQQNTKAFIINRNLSLIVLEVGKSETNVSEVLDFCETSLADFIDYHCLAVLLFAGRNKGTL